MSAKRISLCKGKGSLAHNNREHTANNIDPARTHNNITYVSQPIEQTYDELFSDAVEKFNSRARSDRQIKNSYFEHLFGQSPDIQAAKWVITGRSKQKSFYEELIQIGDKDDSGVGSVDGQTAATILDEYMKGWQERNPQFHVFNAVLHLDECTPHLHIDYIPVAESSRGLSRQNGMAKALDQMGFNSRSAQGFKDWRQRERDVLTELCEARGIEIAPPEESRGISYEVDVYKAKKDAGKAEMEKLDAEIKKLEARISDLSTIFERTEKNHIKLLEDKRGVLEGSLNALQGQIKMGRAELSNLQPQIERAEKRLANFEKGRKARKTVDEIAKSAKGTLSGRVSYTVEQDKSLIEYARAGSDAADKVLELEAQLRVANGKLEPYEKKAHAYDEMQKAKNHKPTLDEIARNTQIKRFMEIPELERKRILDEWRVKGRQGLGVGRAGYER